MLCQPFWAADPKGTMSCRTQGTAWPNGSYSEKMPRHSGPYWGVVWTLPITSIPRAKCSTWKLGQNGLILPFLRSFPLFHGISAFFFIWLAFFSKNDANKYFITLIHARPKQEKNRVKLTWPDLRDFQAKDPIFSTFELFELYFQASSLCYCYLATNLHWMKTWEAKISGQD